MALWYDEVHDHSLRFGLRVKRTLFADQSPFQKVVIVETDALGRALLLDDLWMTAEGDEKPYHELIVHPALTTAPKIARVLIIGGGDGGTAREVLRHPEVERVHLVEVDRMVVDASRQFLPSIGTAWDDPRLEVVIADGIEWVAKAAANSYDVVIVDGSDPVGPAVGLFNRQFYENCARITGRDGVFVSQAESPGLQREVHLEMLRTLSDVFPVVRPYYGTVSIYPGGAWSWVFASHGVDPREWYPQRVERIEATAEVYNREVHMGAFAVPNHIRRALEKRL